MLIGALLVIVAVVLLAAAIWQHRQGSPVPWNRRAGMAPARPRAIPGPAAAARTQRILNTVAAGAVGATLLFGLIFALSGAVGLSAIAALGGVIMPGWWAEVQRTRQTIRVSEQLDQAMGLLTAKLRGGMPLELAVMETARSIPPPLSGVLDLVASATNVGITFDRAIQDVRHHPAVAEHSDFQVWATQVQIAKERGANIVAAFETLREVIAARRRFRGSVSERMGEHVIQAVVISGIGLFVLGAYALMTPDGLSPLLGSTLGRSILLGAVLGNTLILRWSHVGLLRQLRHV